MRMLFGIFLCFLGVSGFFIAGLYHETVIWIISVLLLVIGVIIVFLLTNAGNAIKRSVCYPTPSISAPSVISIWRMVVCAVRVAEKSFNNKKEILQCQEQ